MATTTVRYQAKPERAEEHPRIEGVFAEQKDARPCCR